jgi:hypothetical protein
VTINDPHVVVLGSAMPAAFCQDLEVIGTFSMQGSAITVNGVQIMVDTENIVTN